MKAQTTDGVILRVHDYGEADQIVLFFTQGLGKLAAIAKHARKSRRRFGTLLQHFNLVKLTVRFRPHQAIGFLEEVRPMSSWEGIYREWRRIMAASFLIDCIAAMTREGGSHPPIFEAARDALSCLNAGEDWVATLARFEYRLLAASGLGPVMRSCVACHHLFSSEEPSYWVHAAGGLSCGRCLPMATPFEVMSVPLRRTLQSLATGTRGESDGEWKGALVLLYHFICYHLGRQVRSWEVLARMGLVEASGPWPRPVSRRPSSRSRTHEPQSPVDRQATA